MEKLYVLTETELKELLIRDFELSALEWAGVDNWIGYEEAAGFLQELPQGEEYNSLEDYAIAQVNGYPQMIED